MRLFPRLRRRVALFICPELRAEALLADQRLARGAETLARKCWLLGEKIIFLEEALKDAGNHRAASVAVTDSGAGDCVECGLGRDGIVPVEREDRGQCYDL